MSALGSKADVKAARNAAADFCTNSPYSGQAINLQEGHAQAMLTEIYIEALLVDEVLADEVWGVWNAGEINNLGACWLWLWIAVAGYLAGRYPDERRNGGHKYF